MKQGNNISVIKTIIDKELISIKIYSVIEFCLYFLLHPDGTQGNYCNWKNVSQTISVS